MRTRRGGTPLAGGENALGDLWGEIETRLGLCPSFFRLAAHDPRSARALWQIAQLGYVDVPAASLAKEQLFAYLSRFCSARYCVARHMAFLVRRELDDERGPSPRMHPAAVQALLDDSVPDPERLRAGLAELQTCTAPIADWPTFEMPLGRSFRDAVTVAFLEPSKSPEALSALQRLLGTAGYQQLMLFLGFVRLANFWTEVHPDLRFEADVEALLAEHATLARLVLNRPSQGFHGRQPSREGEVPAFSEIEAELANLRATEAALAARLEHLDAITANAPVLIAELDREKRYRFVNRRYAEFFGASPAALAGRSVVEVIGREAYAVAAPHMDAVLEGRTIEFEALVRSGAGRRCWLRSSYAPLRDASGRVAGFVAGITDITDHKLEEQARIASESRLRAAQAASGIGIFEWDIVNDRVIWDERLRAIWGVDGGDDLTFHAFVAGLHSEDLLAARAAVESSLDPQGTGAYDSEYRVVHSSTGRITWVHATGQVEFVDGQPARMIGAVFNVTQRREAEEARALTEERLKLAAEAAGFGTYYQNIDTGELDWSAEARAIVGLDPDEPLTVERVVAITHPEDRARIQAKVRAHQQATGPAEFEDEYRCLRPDGTVRWILAKGRRYGPAGTDAPGPRIAAGTILDITARKRAEERQRLLMNELNHRVKNMLTVVQSLASQTVTSAAEGFTEIFSARLRALAGAHDLLTQGGWEGATLAAVVETALMPFRNPAESDERVTFAGPEVRLSPNAAVTLSLAFHELATNAIKYGALSVPGGSIQIRWRIAGDHEPQFLDLEWLERGGPPARVPARSGFGSRLIERALAREFNGRSRIEFTSNGVECRMSLALSDRIRSTQSWTP